MMRKWSTLFLFAALLVLVSMPAFAQVTTARGSLGGVVYDTTNAAVPDATVTITGPTESETATSGPTGLFLFPDLIPGYYSVRVQKQGFKVAEVKNVEVLINTTQSIRVTIEPGAVTQTVEVAAPVFTVDSSSSSVSTDLPDTFYQRVPLQRNVSSIFYLAPGVASGLGTGISNPSISGSSGLENLYVADGVTLNDPAYGGLGVYTAVYESVGTGINLSFIKDVQVLTAALPPQYGRVSGGVALMTTKTGTTSTHGVIGGYFGPPGMSALYLNQDDFHPTNLHGRHLHQGEMEGDFELGGYVPGFKKHLFYFSAVNPTYDYNVVAPALGSGLYTYYSGQLDRRTNYLDYAAKLTWQINDKNTIESSVFGDPSHTGNEPWSTLNTNNTSAQSKWLFGTRSWVARYTGTIGSDWLVDGAFSWFWNKFDEVPSSAINEIVDNTQIGGLPGQRGAFVAQGLGFTDNYDSNSKAIYFDMSKQYSFGGRHTISIGYNWLYPNYNDIEGYSGPRFAVPSQNATDTTKTGATGSYLSAAQTAVVGGGMTNASFELELAPSSCTLCPLMNIPGFSTPQAVVLQQTRGWVSSGITNSVGKYHAAYINDSWQMGTHVTLNLGLRWEQQRIGAAGVSSVFNDMWSPRIGFIVDPKGDRKSKLYFNFGRYAWYMPLDAAVRELSGETDYYNTYTAPAFNSTTHMVTLNSFGTVTPAFDSAHLLNYATGGINTGVSVTGELTGSSPVFPGTRMEYSDEFVVGAEHEFRGGIVASARYVDRRMKRVIEDQLGISVEAAFAGFAGSYGIGNPSATSDYVINQDEITFSKGTYYSGTDGNGTPPVNKTVEGITDTYGAPSACFDTNGYMTPYNVENLADTFGNILGSACFPAINENPWTNSSGKVLASADFGGEAGSDGKPDGYPNPIRNYQAVELEVNKALSHNWALLANYRVGRLVGNYEGAFRNDNNQSDPGISSLFDLTAGELGTLGYQLAIGPLNTDRRQIFNVESTYVLPRSPLKNMVFAGGLTVQSGVPLTTLAAQQLYVNAGEVPINGRGDLGRSPITGVINGMVQYPISFGERYKLKLQMDVFNIADTRRSILINQNVDLEFGELNGNFKTPSTFTVPFSARATVLFEF
ncbi:MAG: carboxypeptidase regulatory-like domain-containing protein [Candidatus Acidiferrales bacterium]